MKTTARFLIVLVLALLAAPLPAGATR